MKFNPRIAINVTVVLYILFAGFFLSGCSQSPAPASNQIAQAQIGNSAPQPAGAPQGES